MSLSMVCDSGWDGGVRVKVRYRLNAFFSEVVSEKLCEFWVIIWMRLSLAMVQKAGLRIVLSG